jgi:hypothetical protein
VELNWPFPYPILPPPRSPHDGEQLREAHAEAEAPSDSRAHPSRAAQRRQERLAEERLELRCKEVRAFAHTPPHTASPSLLERSLTPSRAGAAGGGAARAALQGGSFAHPSPLMRTNEGEAPEGRGSSGAAQDSRRSHQTATPNLPQGENMKHEFCY